MNIPGTQNIYPIRTLLRWLWAQLQINRFQAFVNMAIGMAIVGLSFFFVWCTKLCIDCATGHGGRISLLVATIMLVASILLQIVFTYVSQWVKAILGVKAQNAMQHKIFQHALMAGWSGMERFHSGDVLNRIEKDVTDIVTFVTESLPSLITICVQFLGAFLFLFMLDRTLAVVVVTLLPCFILISRIYIKQMRRLTRNIRKTDSNIQSLIQESIQHRTVLKALRQDTSIVGRLIRIQKHLSRQVRQKTKYSSISAMVMNLGFAAGYLFAFLWGVNGLYKGTITYGALIAFIQLVAQIQGPTRSLTRYIPIFISTFTASERLLELEDIPREQDVKPVKLHKGLMGVRFNDITYKYDEHSNILNEMTYDFPPGSFTAIMGETGAGKTTLMRLLLALIFPNSGNVEIYNDEVKFPTTAETRGYFSYVPQGNTLFSGTIRQNLHLGDPEASHKKMMQALHLACADFVSELPEGIETLCGEEGYGLSEGQAQRICIARAFLQPGQILLLDEATSALDGTTEIQVLKNIREHFSDRTVIVVSHRPAVVQFCSHQFTLLRQKRGAASHIH